MCTRPELRPFAPSYAPIATMLPSFERDISPGDITCRATLTIASSTLRAQQALAGEPGRG
jgi:hypothetical protein